MAPEYTKKNMQKIYEKVCTGLEVTEEALRELQKVQKELKKYFDRNTVKNLKANSENKQSGPRMGGRAGG